MREVSNIDRGRGNAPGAILVGRFRGVLDRFREKQIMARGGVKTTRA